jgi:hypothetical protein
MHGSFHSLTKILPFVVLAVCLHSRSANAGDNPDDITTSPSALAAAGKDYVEWDRYPQVGEEHQRANFFYWYVMGSMFTWIVERQLCPGPFKGTQIAFMVSKYLNDHPENWQQSPPRLILAALQPTFPCPAVSPARPSSKRN